MIKKIATAAVYVADQKKALAFWTEKVGFELRDNIEMGNGMSWMEVAPPGAESCLVLYPQKLMSNFRELKPSIVFACEEIENLCARLKANGVRFPKDLADLAWGKFASFADEDGNEFGLKGN
ncbi:MAG: lactoylglutathione lyase [Verrucomicrobiota bacterium]|jgi:predicted enzyme related to lactoylglutathione lyase